MMSFKNASKSTTIALISSRPWLPYLSKPLEDWSRSRTKRIPMAPVSSQKSGKSVTFCQSPRLKRWFRSLTRLLRQPGTKSANLLKKLLIQICQKDLLRCHMSWCSIWMPQRISKSGAKRLLMLRINWNRIWKSRFFRLKRPSIILKIIRDAWSWNKSIEQILWRPRST